MKGGGTVLFSEVTEVRDGVQMLAARCPDEHTRDRLAQEMKWYDDYLDAGGVDRDANPTPGNKRAVSPPSWKRPWAPSPRAGQVLLWSAVPSGEAHQARMFHFACGGVRPAALI